MYGYTCYNLDHYYCGIKPIFIIILCILSLKATTANSPLPRIHERSITGYPVINQVGLFDTGDYLILTNLTFYTLDSTKTFTFLNRTFVANTQTLVDPICVNPCYMTSRPFVYHVKCECTRQLRIDCIDVFPTTSYQDFVPGVCYYQCRGQQTCLKGCITSRELAFNLNTSPIYSCDQYCSDTSIMFYGRTTPATRVCFPPSYRVKDSVFYNQNFFEEYNITSKFMNNTCWHSTLEIASSLWPPSCNDTVYKTEIMGYPTISNISNTNYKWIQNLSIVLPQFTFYSTLFEMDGALFIMNSSNIFVSLCVEKMCVLRFSTFSFLLNAGEAAMSADVPMHVINCQTESFCFDPFVCCNPSLVRSIDNSSEAICTTLNDGVYCFSVFPTIITIYNGTNNTYYMNITGSAFIVQDGNFEVCGNNCVFYTGNQTVFSPFLLERLIPTTFETWQVVLMAIAAALLLLLICGNIYYFCFKKIPKIDSYN